MSRREVSEAATRDAVREVMLCLSREAEKPDVVRRVVIRTLIHSLMITEALSLQLSEEEIILRALGLGRESADTISQLRGGNTDAAQFIYPGGDAPKFRN